MGWGVVFLNIVSNAKKLSIPDLDPRFVKLVKIIACHSVSKTTICSIRIAEKRLNLDFKTCLDFQSHSKQVKNALIFNLKIPNLAVFED